MKYSLIILFCSFLNFHSLGQSIKIKNDTIFDNNVAIGLLKEHKGKPKIFFKTSQQKKKYKKNLQIKKANCKIGVDEYLFEECFIFDTKNEEILNSNNVLVGSCKEINSQGDNYILLTLFSSSINKDFVDYCYRKTVPKSTYFIIRIQQEEERKAIIERQRIDSIRQARILNERKRVERFYAEVKENLESNYLDEFEGIYKSIDLGEKEEYEIAIFKSPSNPQNYLGRVLSSTDATLSIGVVIFTFEKTAQENLFFVKYSLKNGDSFENKTATLEGGAVLKMGVKSFIKMYPSKAIKRSFFETNPSVDWQSSGSGVLLNNLGYIATNNHVIQNAKKIRVSFQNDTVEYEAKIISQNESTDVAIIKIEDERYTSTVQPISFNNEISLGQKVFTLGYPISDKMSDNVKVVDGIVSGLNGVQGNEAFFQTSLPLWYGNSGGPCFNSKGQILGLTTQILYDNGMKLDNVAYITRVQNILELTEGLGIDKSSSVDEINSIELEKLIESLVPYSTFLKINY
jgi:S1-C subfamily serine protease